VVVFQWWQLFKTIVIEEKLLKKKREANFCN